MNLVEVERIGKFAHLKLNRVDSLNALSKDFISELSKSIKDLNALAVNYDIQCLVVSSKSDKAFCVGADLKERKKMTVEQTQEALDSLRTLMDSVAAFAAPTIAVVDGAAFGGGLELALACDLRVMSSKAMAALSETKLAIIPGAGGTQGLSRLVGISKAKELIFRAKPVIGDEALKIGLCNICCDSPLEKALSWAEEISKNGPIALVQAKKAIDSGFTKDLSSALDDERSCYENLINSEDRSEGLKAFVEKRDPLYKGK